MAERAPMAALATLLAALAMIGPFAIDTYLPSFPAIQAGLGVTTVQMQQTLSVYLVAFAVMTLFHLFPKNRGLAASLLGFAHSFVSAIAAGVISALLSHSDIALALGMAGIAAIGWLSWLLFLRLERQKRRAVA